LCDSISPPYLYYGIGRKIKTFFAFGQKKSQKRLKKMGKTFVWRRKISISEQLLSRRGTSAEGNNITS
jgi:hypothetical protein